VYVNRFKKVPIIKKAKLEEVSQAAKPYKMDSLIRSYQKHFLIKIGPMLTISVLELQITNSTMDRKLVQIQKNY
jgi:hypothetical protein